MALPYLLPSNPALNSLDPLSFTNSDNPTHWDVITSCIASFRLKAGTVWQLPSLIEDLAYSLHGKADINTKFLSNFLANEYPDSLHTTPQTVLDAILEYALSLPAFFPKHAMIHLSESHPTEILNPGQIKCLVAHQLLGTLTPPKHNTWGCTILCWYSDPQPLTNAIFGYLRTVFHFLHSTNTTEQPVLYRYCSRQTLQLATENYSWQSCGSILFDHLIIEATSADSTKFPHDTLNCMLVASNKLPGFGISCTQEELVTAACPALLPFGALLSPTLGDDAALLAERVRPASAWRGRGRDARVVGCLDTAEDFTFLLLDALELDDKDPHSEFPLRDLEPHNLLRELHKAFIGFFALHVRDIKEIASPLWGTGAFGGDPIVKAIVLAMAGARSGVKVWLSVDEHQTYGTTAQEPKIIDIVRQLQRNCPRMSVGDAWKLLATHEARRCADGQRLAELF